MLICLSLFVLPGIIKKKATRFFLWAMLISLIPFCAGLPNERVLLLSGCGACALIGLCFNAWFLEERPKTSRLRLFAGGFFVYFLILVHVILSPIVLLMQVNQMTVDTQPFLTKPSLNLPGDGPDSSKKILYLNHPLGLMARAPAHILKVGQIVSLAYMTVKVLKSLPDGNPRLVEFTFRDPIDDPNNYFMQWRVNHFERVQIPGVGETLRLPGSGWMKTLSAAKE